MVFYECPTCGRNAVLCTCDALSYADQRLLISEISGEFSDLEQAISVADQESEAHNLRYIAAMEYIFKNAPDSLREEIWQAFRTAFGIEADYRGPNGERLFSLGTVAAAMGMSVAEVRAQAEAFLEPGDLPGLEEITRVQ